jgi:pimeloyl-ACP methyl ester carboxylesterase
MGLTGLVSCLASCSAPPHSRTTGRNTVTEREATKARTHESQPAAPVPIWKVPISRITTSLGTVAYRRTGNGPSVVLIMGYSSSMDGWDPRFVDALARTHTVYIFNNAGIAGTSMPPGTLTIGSMARQTAAFLEALHLRRADVLGWSMGGMIAQSLAVQDPNQVGHLVLCATIPGNGHSQAPAASEIEALANVSGANALALLNSLFPPNQKAQEERYIKAILKYPHFSLAPPNVIHQQLLALARWSSGKDPSGLRLSSIKAPTLVADGKGDVLIPVANDVELAKRIPRARLVLYPDASHAFLFQYEKSFVPLLDRFFAGKKLDSKYVVHV